MLKQSLKIESFPQKISNILKKEIELSRSLFAKKGLKKYSSADVFKKAGV